MKNGAANYSNYGFHKKMIDCEHAIVQHVVSLFFQLIFNKLTRRLCKEYVGRKVKNVTGVNLPRNFAFPRTLSFSPVSKNLVLGQRSTPKKAVILSPSYDQVTLVSG